MARPKHFARAIIHVDLDPAGPSGHCKVWSANFRNSGAPLEFKVEAMSLSMFSICSDLLTEHQELAKV